MMNDRVGINFHFGLLTNNQIGHFLERMKANTIKDLLSRWPNRSAVLQDALVDHRDLELVAVHRWAQRNTIPPKYWSALIKGASARDIALTADELVAAHAPSSSVPPTNQEDAA